MANSSTDTSDIRGAMLDREEDQEDGGRARMSFLEHLDELRRRILYSIYAILGGCALTFYYWDRMYLYLTHYFKQQGGTALIFSAPSSAFMFSLKIGFFSGLLVASPFVFSQLWLFVAPGLYAREKKVVIPFVACSSVLFLGGAFFAHFIAFPSMWKFFSSYQIGDVLFYPQLDLTWSFYVKMILGMGIVFEMPILVFFLARFGIVTASFLWKKSKYAILIIFIIAAVITPSADMATQCIFAAPMIVLYVLSIGVAWLFGKKRKPATV